MAADRRAALIAGAALLAALAACGGGERKPATSAADPVAEIAGPVRLSSAVTRDGARTLALTIRLTGGGDAEWVTESCNPVAPVIRGEPRPLRACLTNFWSRVALQKGRGELTLDWPLDDPDHALVAGGKVEVAVSLASRCEKSGGPGLFALGDCADVRTLRASAPVAP